MGEEEVNTQCITKATQCPTLPLLPHEVPHLHRSPLCLLISSCRTHSWLEPLSMGSRPSRILPGAIFNASEAL